MPTPGSNFLRRRSSCAFRQAEPVMPDSPVTATPTKPSLEGSLTLKSIIGATVSSAPGLDSNASSFAFVAGSAAVLVSLDENLKPTQHFYRATPNLTTSSKGPSTPTPANKTSFVPLSPAEFPDSPTTKTMAPRDKMKAATCIALSADQKYLAVGETGVNPRVLLFSLNGPSDRPISAVTEHTFGVKCVAFSPDGRYLASLGTINDGFLYIWQINPRTGLKLHSSTRCVSNVRHMAWVGKTLITVGTRYVKVWRLEPTTASTPTKLSPSKSRFLFSNFSPSTPPNSPRPLSGRNCLLNNLKDSVFTSLVRVSDERAITCTEKGDICLIDEIGSSAKLTKIASAGFGVESVAVDDEGRFLWVAGRNGNIRSFNIDDLLSPDTPPESPTSATASDCSTTIDDQSIVAVRVIRGHLLTISEHSIKLSNMDAIHNKPEQNQVVYELPSHKSAVLGVSALTSPVDGATHFSWETSGLVKFWNADGDCTSEFNIPLDQSEPDNELRVVRRTESGYFACGDKYGHLQVFDKEVVYEDRPHSLEITDIAVYEGDLPLIATSSRDTTCAIFAYNNGWDLIQTFDDHKSNVSNILFGEAAKCLISASADRTIVVREALAGLGLFRPFRTIRLKSAPVSMALQKEDILVSCVDRTVHKFDVPTGRGSFFKESVVLDSLTVFDGMLFAVSNTDKTLRAYNNNELIAREWGHTEGLSGLCVLQDTVERGRKGGPPTVVTSGHDGTLMVWAFSKLAPPKTVGTGEVAGKSLPGRPKGRPVLRKVFSEEQLARMVGVLSKEVSNGETPKALEKAPGSPPGASPAETATPLSAIASKSADPPAPVLITTSPLLARSIAHAKSRSEPIPEEQEEKPKLTPVLEIDTKVATPSPVISKVIESSPAPVPVLAPALGTGFGPGLGSGTRSVSATMRGKGDMVMKLVRGMELGKEKAKDKSKESEADKKLDKSTRIPSPKRPSLSPPRQYRDRESRTLSPKAPSFPRNSLPTDFSARRGMSARQSLRKTASSSALLRI